MSYYENRIEYNLIVKFRCKIPIGNEITAKIVQKAMSNLSRKYYSYPTHSDDHYFSCSFEGKFQNPELWGCTK